MKPTHGYEFHIEDIEGYHWLFAPETNEEDIFPVADDIEKAAKIFKVSPEFLKAVDGALSEMAGEIITNLKKDLTDLAHMIDDETS